MILPYLALVFKKDMNDILLLMQSLKRKLWIILLC